MKRALEALLWRLTGGRPMTRERRLFFDAESDRHVYLYVDKRGRKWMARSAWDWYRVGPERRDTRRPPRSGDRRP